MINANKKWMANIIILVAMLTLFSSLALAANNPGHDSLYIEEIGNSTITGRLNITDFVTLEGSLYLKSYLDLIANGTTLSGSPTRNTLVGTNTYLEIDAASGGGLYLDRYGGTVYTGSPSARTDLNVSGNLYIYNPTGASTLLVGNVAVCLANGTNCPAIAGSSSAGGWTNTTTTTSTSLDVNVDSGTLFVDSTNNRVGIGDTTPGYTAEIQNTLSNIQLKVTGANSTGGIQLGTYISLQGSIDVDNNFHRGLLGQGVYYDQQNNTYNLTNQQWDRAALEFLNSGHIAFFTESQDRSATPYLTPTQWNSLERLRITNTGLVGINTKTPSSTLQVNGTANVTYLIITNNTAASCDLKADTRGNVYCGTDATGTGGDGSGGWTNSTQNTTTTLNVGIGTTSPSAKTHIESTTEQLRVSYNSGNYTSLTVSSSGLATLSLAGHSAGLLINKTDASNHLLTLKGASGAATFLRLLNSTDGTVFYIDSDGNPNLPARHYIASVDNSKIGDPDQLITGGGTGLALTSSGAIYFAGGDSTTDIIIDSSGRLGVGTTNPSSPLQVSGITNTTYLVIANNTAAGCDLKADTRGNVYCGTDADTNSGGTVTGTGTGAYIAQFQSASVLNASVIYQNGTNIGIGTTTPSDKLSVVGNINVTGNVLYGGNLTGYGADFAERFTMAEAVFAGDVVCLTKSGSIKKCSKEGDSSVVGVVSEQPTIIGNALAQNSVPVGIVGIVTTKVVGPVEQFDLLTTSSRKGHAQTAELEDFGAILGKAMEGCKKSECQIKVLVGLR
jgi:hypothetical protein